MNNNFKVLGDNYSGVCQTLFKMLDCNALWIMHANPNGDSLNIQVTDKAILDHYWDKKYYLQDPSVSPGNNAMVGANAIEEETPLWATRLGTDCENFKASGFLYDLQQMFNVQEFVSLEKTIKDNAYCFRFFTQHNRFIFLNKLFNNMSFLTYAVEAILDLLKKDFR